MASLKALSAFAAVAVGIFIAVTQVMAETARLTVDQVRALARDAVRRDGLRVDPIMLEAMAEIESSRNPMAIRAEPQIGDASIGLMQTLLGTAQWLYEEMGARKFGEPTAKALMDPEVSIYFAGQYVNWLARFRGENRSEEWIVRAYNGGPSWDTKRKGESDARFERRLAATANHWRKYQEAKRRLQGAS